MARMWEHYVNQGNECLRKSPYKGDEKAFIALNAYDPLTPVCKHIGTIFQLILTISRPNGCQFGDLKCFEKVS